MNEPIPQGPSYSISNRDKLLGDVIDLLKDREPQTFTGQDGQQHPKHMDMRYLNFVFYDEDDEQVGSMEAWLALDWLWNDIYTDGEDVDLSDAVRVELEP